MPCLSHANIHPSLSLSSGSLAATSWSNLKKYFWPNCRNTRNTGGGKYNCEEYFEIGGSQPHICPSSGFHRKITRGLKHSQENPALFHSDVLFLVLQLLLLCAEKNICKLLIQLLPYLTVLIQIFFSSSRRFIAVIVSA